MRSMNPSNAQNKLGCGSNILERLYILLIIGYRFFFSIFSQKTQKNTHQKVRCSFFYKLKKYKVSRQASKNIYSSSLSL